MHGKVARPAVPLAASNTTHRAVDLPDLLLLLFITPEGSTTQHHHCKDRRKTQETKN